MAAKRVTFVKDTTGAADYADARFDIMLDGVKVGEVTSNVESVETSASALSSSRIGQYRSAKVWRAEGVRYALDRKTRIDAAADVLESAKGISFYAARTLITGKKW